MRIFFLLWCLISFIPLKAQQKILFVGNSLTYYNDLPELVRKIAEADGLKLKIKSISLPNYALEDHWIEGKAAGEIKSTHYDFVVFQQGPSALKTSRSNLIEYSLLFAKICRTQNSAVAFYSVWPSVDRSFDFENVFHSYAAAADTTNGIVCPAGNAWLEVWKRNEDFPLYSSDGFHPTEQGSLLAAMVIYGSLFKKTNFDFLQRDRFVSGSVTPKHFNLLKEAASASLK